MNCKTYRNRILLSDSGELSLRHQADLAEHLEQCADCRGFANEMHAMTETARNLLPQETPHPSVMVAIRSAAHARHESKRLWLPVPALRLAYAAAAVVLVAAISWFSVSPQPQTVSRVAELSAVATMVAESVVENGASIAAVDDNDLDSFARQLLELEGFGGDELFDDDVSLFEEPAPTTTQSHRTHVIRV